MSENTPPNAPRPSPDTSSSSSNSPDTSQSSARPGPALPPAGADAGAAAQASSASPPSPSSSRHTVRASTDTVASDPPVGAGADSVAAGAMRGSSPADSATAEAAERASSDTLESASAVEPASSPPSHAAEAAEARVTAARETAEQEAAAEQSAELQLQQEREAAAARGAPPPGFGSQPDFDTPRPPPPGAVPPPEKPAYLKQSDSPWSVFGRTMVARARRLFDRAGQRITQRTLRIGVSARIFHPEPGAVGLRGKTLQYLEESVAHWVMSRDVMVFMIPTVGHQGMLHPSNIRLRDYAKHLDGLLLQGGADVSPQTYAGTEASAEWPGDRVRDMYELELLYEFIESGKPVLGICRGCQLINVAFGGTLYQDIATEVPTAGVHVNERYDQHRHAVRFPQGSTLVNMFPGRHEALVNSIHHQAVKTLGRDLNVEAVSSEDGLIEAVRYRRAPFVMGVQWHPEFHRAGGPELLDCTPLLDSFLRASRETRF
ncbi:gamma-glutamyl-gamma-aminobutyrate hydrolase family protein [Trinickia symbiotica]|uniref:Peptidase C26 n=1 Tax=Trinickia symbiotica TaxID=863227 RepID=A0A2N7X669_9BURK|nr:type 1 glutamine amidotransferase [Trinickia symbiotica]PMS37117.1 peptidase C26 [Trinickia symbiotica]